MRVLSLVPLLFTLPFDLLSAQAGGQQAYSVSGTVVSSTDNQPMRGALVQLLLNGQKTAMTGPDGHFQIDGVSAGYANLSARRPGFDQQHVRQQRVKVDSNVDSILLKITPLSKISGRILDREGEAIEGINVQCLYQQIVNGRKMWQQHGGANTDETGSFLLEDLNPGNYILTTQEKQLYFAQPKSEAARYVYPPTFYPDAPSRDLAQQIEVGPGEDMKAEMTLRSVRGNRVSFVTIPPVAHLTASIEPEGERMGLGNVAQADKNGVVTFSAVPGGNWKIVVRANGGAQGQEQLYGELEVQVASSDIDNLKLPVGKLAEIPVMISGGSNQGILLQLISKNSIVTNELNRNANGDMSIPNITPGTYKVVQTNSNSSICIASMISGSQDLLRDELVVSGAQTPPIQIVTGSNCAQVTVTANTKENMSVVVTSDNRGFEPRVVWSGNGNGVLVTGLVEGDYKLYAIDDVSDLEYTNPEAMREFKGESIHLEAGQKATVQLEVNERHQK